MKAAVYGTLKRWFGNHIVMEGARGQFIKEDYIPFDKIDSVGFPRIKFNSESNKYIKVEIFEVEEEGVLNHLDRLEWYHWEGVDYNHYNRIKVKTLSWEEVYVYEINSNIADESDKFYDKEEDNILYYNWK